MPVEITLEKPTALTRAQSRMAVHSAPDCEMSPIDPGRALPALNVPLKRMSVRMTPRQFGPTKRRLKRRALVSTSRSRATPAVSDLAKARRHDDSAVDAALAALRDDVRDCSGGRHDDGDVDGARDIPGRLA